MTEIKARCIEEEGKVGVRLERARRAALTLRGGVSVSSAEKEAGMLGRKDRKDSLSSGNKKRLGIECEEGLDGSYRKINNVFHLFVTKGQDCYVWKRRRMVLRLFMEILLRPSGEPLHSQLRGLKY